jgi:hypothetical protein
VFSKHNPKLEILGCDKYQQAFLTPLPRERWSAELTLSLTLPCIYTFTFSLSFLFFSYLFPSLWMTKNSIPIYQFSAPTETSLMPWESSQPIQTPNYRLSPQLITMVQSLSFSGKEDGNPYLHI